jgi:hypothetical protein
MPLFTTAQLSRMTPEEVNTLLSRCGVEHIAISRNDFKTQATELIKRGVCMSVVEKESTEEVVKKLKDAITLSIAKCFIKELLKVSGIHKKEKLEVGDILAAYILLAKTPDETMLTPEQKVFLGESRNLIKVLDEIIAFISKSKHGNMEEIPPTLMKEFVKRNTEYKDGQEVYDGYNSALEQSISIATNLVDLYQARKNITTVEAALLTCEESEQPELNRRICAYKIREIILIKEIDDVIPSLNVVLIDHSILTSLRCYMSAMITMLYDKFNTLCSTDTRILVLSAKIQLYRDKRAGIDARLARSQTSFAETD